MRKGKEHKCPICKKEWVCQHPACPFPYEHACIDCTIGAQTESVIEREQPITFKSLEKVIAEVALKTPNHIWVTPSVMAELKKLFEGGIIGAYVNANKPTQTLFGMKIEVVSKDMIKILPQDIREALLKGEVVFTTIPPISCRDFPVCSHKHDKAWDAGCAVCTPDDNCCKTNEDECPLED